MREVCEKMITVYADIVFLINFIMVAFVFICVRLFLKVKRSVFLCILGGLFAGLLYTVIALWRGAYFLRNPVGYLLLMAASVYIAYLPKSIGAFFRLFGAVVIGAFFVGGICSGLFYFTNVGNYIGENLSYGLKHISAGVFVISVGVSYIVICCIRRIYRNSVIRKREFYEVRAELKWGSAEFKALADTGSSLKEPVTGKRIIVAEFDAVKAALPECGRLKEDLYGYIADRGGDINFYFALYKSLGNSSGILPCFEPDRLYINEKPYENILIGISFMKLSSDGSFRGLINTEILEVGEVKENACNAA